jgi:hypothetical protein
MSQFLISPMNLEEGELIVAIASANNGIGDSTFSLPNSIG